MPSLRRAGYFSTGDWMLVDGVSSASSNMDADYFTSKSFLAVLCCSALSNMML